MDKYTYEGENQKRIEQFQLLIYTIYGLNMAIASIQQRRGEWISLFVLLMLGASWIIYAGKYYSYGFRARFTSIMMQASLILYAVYLDSVLTLLPIYMLFVVLMGLYGITDIIGYSVISILFIFGFHGFVLKTLPCETTTDVLYSLLHLANVFFLQFVVYTWTKNNSEGSRQLRETIEELGYVEQSKDDFLANISHEIRTPLNTICGMSEIVLREELPYKTKENIMNIQLAGRNLTSIVSDIVDYSELQSGRIELEEEAYSISSTINDVINMTMARKNDKNIELVVDCDANIPCALLGDEKKLRRIIMKLVDNAIKFTEEGCVGITVGFRKESYGINLLVAVRDTGIGMDEASLERLFARFSQADTDRNRRVGGIGLGLAISNALVKRMGGAITVRSKPGKGTVVQVAIPQKVLDEAPMATVRDAENLNVATYIDMEQFDMVEIRDEYSATILHMVEQLKVKCHICRNLAELQRTFAKEHLTHVFISAAEYRANQKFFDELALKTKIIVVMNRAEEKFITNPRLLRIYKPFHILTIVSVLNAPEGLEKEHGLEVVEKFETINAHVLVVDDNRMNIRVIEGILSNYNIKVTTAISGQEALQKIAAADYDFVFMDHMMPEMDGVETLHRIRHKVGTYFQKVPIIALTANAVAGTREMFLAEGFSDFLEKPVERSVLERVLKRNLPPNKIVYKSDLAMSVINEQTTPDVKQEVIGETGALPSLEQMEEVFGPKGLDVGKGILYCNGVDGYLSVLRGYCDDSDELDITAEKLFEKEDWKNYIIAVHGIKGAMRSIGAVPLAELARKLEFAGKEGRIEYIKDGHSKLMEEYRKLFTELRENEWIMALKEDAEESKEEANVECTVLEGPVFDKIIEDMETAMYSLDSERLLEIVSELQCHMYRETPLKELLAPVRKKVEMSDYVSAVELTVRLKNQLESKER